MKIRILRHINGPLGVDWLPGEEHDCPVALARELVGIRAAEYVVEPPVTGLVTYEAPDPVVAHRDPVRRSRK